jgi:hypothetical protein
VTWRALTRTLVAEHPGAAADSRYVPGLMCNVKAPLPFVLVLTTKCPRVAVTVAPLGVTVAPLGPLRLPPARRRGPPPIPTTPAMVPVTL